MVGATLANRTKPTGSPSALVAQLDCGAQPAVVGDDETVAVEGPPEVDVAQPVTPLRASGSAIAHAAARGPRRALMT